MVQNVAAKLLTRSSKSHTNFDLPIKIQDQYKVLVATYKALHARDLYSHLVAFIGCFLLQVCAFEIVALTFWKCLLLDLKSVGTVKHIKTYLFRLSFMLFCIYLYLQYMYFFNTCISYFSSSYVCIYIHCLNSLRSTVTFSSCK